MKCDSMHMQKQKQLNLFSCKNTKPSRVKSLFFAIMVDPEWEREFLEEISL